MELALPKYHVYEFSDKADNFEFFSLNFGKLRSYLPYFGSNNVEGVAVSWVEVEMSWVEVHGAGWGWVEVGARFSKEIQFFIRKTQFSIYQSLK